MYKGFGVTGDSGSDRAAPSQTPPHSWWSHGTNGTLEAVAENAVGADARADPARAYGRGGPEHGLDLQAHGTCESPADPEPVTRQRGRDIALFQSLEPGWANGRVTYLIERLSLERLTSTLEAMHRTQEGAARSRQDQSLWSTAADATRRRSQATFT